MYATSSSLTLWQWSSSSCAVSGLSSGRLSLASAGTRVDITSSVSLTATGTPKSPATAPPPSCTPRTAMAITCCLSEAGMRRRPLITVLLARCSSWLESSSRHICSARTCLALRAATTLASVRQNSRNSGCLIRCWSCSRALFPASSASKLPGGMRSQCASSRAACSSVILPAPLGPASCARSSGSSWVRTALVMGRARPVLSDRGPPPCASCHSVLNMTLSGRRISARISVISSSSPAGVSPDTIGMVAIAVHYCVLWGARSDGFPLLFTVASKWPSLILH
mmetsp:Transcript_19364/g.49265  ORF Transcript_19364/g.49265 Transcript_19364/m.49265 type:complete len:282 (-) Transcript_19364:124-969(-)